MAKVVVPFDKSMLQLLMTKGNRCEGFGVEEGISPLAYLQRAWIDEYGTLQFQFEDPTVEEDGVAQVIWKFCSPGEANQNFLFYIRSLKLAETTYWSSGTRLRFVGMEDRRFEVKFDIPMEVEMKMDGPFFIACGEDK